jgi:hypothetical protein
MKNLTILALLLALLFMADRLVRTENQYYALLVGSCKASADHPRQLGDCLRKVQTRTSWFWHLYYGLTQSLPAVPLWTND